MNTCKSHEPLNDRWREMINPQIENPIQAKIQKINLQMASENSEASENSKAPESSGLPCSFICFCGKATVLRTSWSDINPGRRFQACEKGKVEGCGWFCWEDNPSSDRALGIILGLLRKLNKKNGMIQKLEELNSKLEEVNKSKGDPATCSVDPASSPLFPAFHSTVGV